MEYYAFLDETGDHGLSFIDENFPIFLLVGIFISESEYAKLELEISKFKRKYFGTEEVILHSRDIRRVDGPFQILFDLDVKREFYVDLNNIQANARYKIFGVGVDKKRHIETYGKTARDPYSMSLSFLVERMIYECDDMKDCDAVAFIIEKRGKKEDALLLTHYNRLQNLGTYYVQPHRIRQKIKSFDFKHKRENDIGLQIADLCAYPIARNILNPSEPNPTYEIIKDKIRNMQRDGHGIKMFP